MRSVSTQDALNATPSQVATDNTKKASKQPSAPDRLSLPWNDITHMLGHESTTALSKGIMQLYKICESNPSVSSQITSVIEELEQARRTALITMQFVQSRTIADHETGYVSLRQVVMEVLEQRAEWLKKRHITISVGPLDARLVANITALFLLIDELVSWAAKLAPEVVVVINTSLLNRSGIQLLVYAKFGQSHAVEAEWTNVGWYLWHKLATAVGGSAELNVMDDALCVSVTFTPIAVKAQLEEPQAKSTPNAPTTQHEVRFARSSRASLAKPASGKSTGHVYPSNDLYAQASVRELSHGHDIAEIVQGCHVIVIAADLNIRNSAMRAVASLGLHVKVASDVHEALQLAARSQVPHAVIYHSQVNNGEMLQLRHEWASSRKTAYVELCDAQTAQLTTSDNADFHFTSIGTMSTAHVVTDAIAESLIPALVFELCKVL